MSQATERPPEEWKIGDEGPLRTAILFLDLVSSSEFGSVLGLHEYSRYVDWFHHLAAEQTEYMFITALKSKYLRGVHYEVKLVGDELAVFLHSDNASDNVYQLICLAIVLKCGWLGAPFNAARLEEGLSTAELAAGVSLGMVWARRTETGFEKRGFA